MGKWLKALLSSDGSVSSKRVIAFFCFGFACFLSLATPPAPILVGAWITAGTTLLTAAAVTHT